MSTKLDSILQYIIYSQKKAYLTLGFFFIIYLLSYGQTKPVADSLESLFTQGTYDKQDKLIILKELAVNHSDVDMRLRYSELLIESASELDSVDYLFQGYLEKGTSLRLKGDLTSALESYFEGAKIAEMTKKNDRLGAIHIAIADVYSVMGNHNNAVKYHQSAIQLLRQEKDSINIATALLNAGDEYTNFGNLDSALIYTTEAEVIFHKLHSQLGQAYSLGNLGMIYAKLGIDLKAEYHMNQAILLLQELDEHYPIAVYLTYIADIYLEKNEEDIALNYAHKSLELSQKYGMKKEASDAYLMLSEIYERGGNIGESFKYYKNHISYKDSVNNITSVQQMADLRTDFEVSKKQIEVDLLNQQKRNQQIIVVAIIIALILVSLLAFGLYRRFLFIRTTNKVIEQERNRSDNLLLNILPKETAQELKQNGKVQAKKFESVTVLFSDFKGFTHYAEYLSPEKLVERVDFYFSKFDSIIQKHGLEKIKTVGDAYMCAGGLPFPTKDHAIKMTHAALEMLEFVKNTKESNPTEDFFEIRIGINTGPVVAGIVGTQKFAYDIWGDTVNIAARMESSSEAGKINVSKNTYDLIKSEFNCEFRGEIEAKNRGMMKMYYVEDSNRSNSPAEKTKKTQATNLNF